MKIKFQGTVQDIAQIEEGTCLMLQDSVLHSCLSGKDSMTAELKVTFTEPAHRQRSPARNRPIITVDLPGFCTIWIRKHMKKGKLRISHETV